MRNHLNTIYKVADDAHSLNYKMSILAWAENKTELIYLDCLIFNTIPLQKKREMALFSMLKRYLHET